MAELRHYQVEAAKEIYDKKRVLIADDMGLGKTAEAIAGKRVLDLRNGFRGGTFVACPPSVKQHWRDQIIEWYKKNNGEEIKVAEIDTVSFDDDVKKARGADFAIIGYPTLSYFGEDKNRMANLRDMGFDYGIIDEAHNAKNPESIRSEAVREIFHSIPYLAVLSGTPIPNTIVDIYALLNLLDKEQFPLHSENSRTILNQFYSLFQRDPELVSRVINEHRIRRTAEEYLKVSFPGINQRNLEILLEDEHRDAYINVYENSGLPPGTKLSHLVSASIDPNLISRNLLPSHLVNINGRMRSSVYRALDDLVEKSVDSNGKILLFSDRKKGVVRNLSERYSKYGALVIDAEVSSDSSNGNLSEREVIRRKFQKDPNHKILIATTVMDEGVDLTAATDVVHLTLPYTPAAFDQRNRRAQRIGEIKKSGVNIHVVMPQLADETPVITEGIANLLADKRRIIHYIEKEPLSLTKRDFEEIRNGGNHTSSHLTPILKNPLRSIFSHFGQLKGKGFKKIQEHYERYPEEASYIARLYSSHWEGFYGGNTAEVYARVIRALEEKESLETKLDIASGPFSLSRKLGEPNTNVDINPHMFNAGRILEGRGQIAPGNIAVQSTFHDLKLDSGSFDLAVCSLGLHFTKTSLGFGKKRINEREQAFREMNRVLRDGGYGIVTLPHTLIGEADFGNFYNSLNHLGFEVLPFSGFYNGRDTNFKVYLAGLKKVGLPDEKMLEPEQMQWKMDIRAITKTKKSADSKKLAFTEEKIITPEFPTEFQHTKTGKSVEDLVRG